MKVVFAHDHRFIPKGKNVYSRSQFPASMWNRYLHAFDKIHVISRRESFETDATLERFERSDHSGVTFSFVPELSTATAQLVNRRKAQRIVQEVVSGADAVIARLPSQIGLQAVTAAQAMGKPWAVEVAGCPWNNLRNYGTLQGKIYAPVMYWRTKAAVAKAPFALYVTEKFLQNRYPSGGVRVACSDVELSPPDKTVLKKRLGRIAAAPATLRLGLIGTLRGRLKGIQTVLEALNQLRAEDLQIEFRVLGGGDTAVWQKEVAEYKLNGVVHFDGVRPAGEPVMSWLDEVDIYLQPSLTEGLPRALIEAMSRGCPAIGSACGGIPELLERDALIRPGNAQELAHLIKRAVADKQWRCSQAERNWEVSAKYARGTLENRRNEFWQNFAEFAAKERKHEVSL